MNKQVMYILSIIGFICALCAFALSSFMPEALKGIIWAFGFMFSLFGLLKENRNWFAIGGLVLSASNSFSYLLGILFGVALFMIYESYDGKKSDEKQKIITEK